MNKNKKSMLNGISIYKFKTKIFALVLASLFIIFLLWYNSFDRIKDILKQIDDYRENIVHFRGQPLSSFSLPFAGSFYKLEDNTGSIWVVSKIDTIEKNTTIYVSGKVKTYIDIDSALDKQLTQYNLKVGKIGPVLIEEQREDFLTTIKNMFKN